MKTSTPSKILPTGPALPMFHHLTLRGGQMTKVAGQTASYAPGLRRALSFLGSSASVLALGSALTMAPMMMPSAFSGNSGVAFAGTCAESAPGSGIWTCSGVAGADLTQTPTSAVGGALIVTTDPSFGVTTAGGNAITLNNAAGDTDITFTDTNASNITGGSDGIFARNNGTGALSVTTTGAVVGTTADGINALNYGTDLTIRATKVTGDIEGINAFNYGLGELLITTTGDVYGVTGHGIDARNYTGTDLTIRAAAVKGNYGGIYAINRGSGELSVTTTGDVNAPTIRSGISALNINGTNLTVTAGAVTGSNMGISAINAGSGAILVTATGDVIGGDSDGMSIGNIFGGVGTDVTINAVSVSGDDDGIDASNRGNGFLSVTATGDVTGSRGDGIQAILGYTATDVKIVAAAVNGYDSGIRALSYGTGEMSITATGDVISANIDGVTAQNINGTDITINVVSANGGQNGINAVTNNGRGSIRITTTGDVTGATRYGVLAKNPGGGDVEITSSGVVFGGGAVGYSGISTQTAIGATSTITLNSGASVSSTSGVAITNNVGDSATTVNTGATIIGEVRLDDGSDDLILGGGDVTAATVLDGGDDSSTADGFIDTVSVTGLGTTLAGASLINWESFRVDGGSVSFSDMALSIGDGAADTGVTVINGGVFDAGTIFALTGNLTTSTGGIFEATGGGTGNVSIAGNVTNNGILTTQDGAAGDVITINGDYTGSGIVMIDTVLGDDSSATDVLAVAGDTSGSSTLDVVNAGGGGDITTLGIEVITVGGASIGDFNLAGDFVTAGGEQAVVAGAYAYTLVQGGDGNFDLVSQEVPVVVPPVAPPVVTPLYQPGAPIYEGYAQNLLALNGVPTLKQRVGERHKQAPRQASQGLSFDVQNTPSPFWVRIEGIDARLEPEVTTTGTQSDISIWKLQGGADFMLHEGASGYLIGGVTLHYGTANSDITSRFGDGSIDTKGYGAGVSATWYANSGLYVDGQLNVTKFDSDLASATLGGLTNGNDGTGYAASVELGQGFPVGQNMTLIPQAQLTYSSVNFDDFTGPYGERVSLDDGESLQLRLGIAAEHEVTTADSQQLLYGIFNLYREFDGGTQIDVSGVKQSSESDDWSAKVGLGGQYTWSEAYTAYGEVSYATGVESLGDSRRVQASLGVRIDF